MAKRYSLDDLIPGSGIRDYFQKLAREERYFLSQVYPLCHCGAQIGLSRIGKGLQTGHFAKYCSASCRDKANTKAYRDKSISMGKPISRPGPRDRAKARAYAGLAGLMDSNAPEEEEELHGDGSNGITSFMPGVYIKGKGPGPDSHG